MNKVVTLKRRKKLVDLQIGHAYVDRDGCPFVFVGMSRFHRNVGELEGAADYDNIGIVPLKDKEGPFYDQEDSNE